MNMNQTLRAVLAGRTSCTIGHFLLGGERVAFGLKHNPTYGTKPSYNGKTGRGGGFDADRWLLLDLLKHELGEAMHEEAVLVIDGKEYRRPDFAGPLSWESKDN